MSYQISLPYPPTVNHYYGHSKSGRVYLREAGKQYRKDVATVVAMSKRKRFEGARVAVHAIIYAPDRRRRDLDNTGKALFDSITHAGIWDDDSQIDDLRITRGKVMKGEGMVTVRIEEI